MSTDLFPWLVFVGFVTLVMALVFLNRRISRGAKGPGPRERERSKPPGLQLSPWELKALDVQVRSPGGSTNRHNLVALVNRLATTAEVDANIALRLDATNEEIAQLLSHIEYQLRHDALPES